ncbi:MAG: RtcB family protein [Candidatus Diapherotrites archaeon]
MKKINNFALDPDEVTLEQFKHCYEQEFVEKAALMPDAHVGYVAPIGSVLVTKDYVVPSWVGFDIGCGMTAVHIKGKGLLEKIKEKKEKIYDKVNEKIPMGKGNVNQVKNITEETKAEYEKLLEKFKEGPYEKDVLQFLETTGIKHLGSLGHGNHFVEIGFFEEEPWIVVHSGSRGVGFKVATRYMKASAGQEKEFEQTFPIHKDSDVGKKYLNILDFGLEFALLNRMEIIRKVISSIEDVLEEKIEYELWVNKNHNHAIEENGLFIHRKGATPAKKGERGVIPANMRDGSFLVEGKGNKEFLESSSHGAGRIMSRTEAKENISMAQFEKSMEGIRGTVEEGTLDESPMAYKNIYEVMEAQKDSVKTVKQLKPLINWKGSNKQKNH